MRVNCDLGESFGSWEMGNDAEMMALIDQANIATGFHAGDPTVMRRTVALAIQHNVAIGAHPGYPDKQGFGRRSMKIDSTELTDLLLYQVAALDGMAQSYGAELSYVKPHGALYNDMMSQPSVMAAVLKALTQYYRPLSLMRLAVPVNSARYTEVNELVAESGVACIYEAFCDRRYHEHGSLVSRSESGAVLTSDEVSEQVTLLISDGCVISKEGVKIELLADSLCVHGDGARALDTAKLVRAALSGKNAALLS